MESILVVFILLMLLSSCTCDIIVINKLSRQKYITIQHDLLISGLEQPLLKVQLNFVQLSATCSTPKIPQSKLYSLHSTNAVRPAVLIVQEENDECDIIEIITEARKNGYGGIIFCTDTIDRYRHIKPVQDFYISVILNSDKFTFSELNAPRYKISIFRDTTVLEDLFKYLCYSLKQIITTSQLFISVLLLLSPVIFVLAFNFVVPKRQSYPTYHSQDQSYQFYQSGHQPYYDWEYDDEDSEIPVSPENDNISEYRQILNVGINAGRKDIERAFRNKAFVLHPDKNVDLDIRERLKREEELKKCSVAKESLLALLN